MADSKSKQNEIIIAGDDGTLYHLTQDDLQAHKMAPNHPAYAQAQKLVAEKKEGVIHPEHFAAQSAGISTGISTDISFTLLNAGAVKAEE
jgi:hypothetical protein